MNYQNQPMMSNMSEGMSEAPNYKYQNEKLLLNIIKTKLGITDEDMYKSDVVKQIVRDSNIDTILG